MSVGVWLSAQNKIVGLNRSHRLNLVIVLSGVPMRIAVAALRPQYPTVVIRNGISNSKNNLDVKYNFQLHINLVSYMTSVVSLKATAVFISPHRKMFFYIQCEKWYCHVIHGMFWVSMNYGEIASANSSFSFEKCSFFALEIIAYNFPFIILMIVHYYLWTIFLGKNGIESKI